MLPGWLVAMWLQPSAAVAADLPCGSLCALPGLNIAQLGNAVWPTSGEVTGSGFLIPLSLMLDGEMVP